jgi:hypothetical protein
MGLGNAKPSEFFVPSYEMSGKPWVTGSVTVGATAQEVTFPTVTRWVQIVNNSTHDVRIGFSKNGVDANPDANYYLLEGQSTSTGQHTVRWELRCKSIFLKRGASSDATVSIIAGLTDIADLHASLSGSAGVG